MERFLRRDAPASRRAPIAMLAFVSALGACSAPAARLYAGYMRPETDGDLGLTASVNGTTLEAVGVSLQNDLGLDDTSDSIYVRAELDAGPVRVTGSAFQYSERGTGTLSIDFGDLTANTTVDSELDFTNAKAALTIDLFDFGPVRLSPGVGVDLFDLDATVSDRTTGLTETVDELLPIPMVFVQTEFDLGPVGGIVDVGAMDVDYEDAEGTFIDVEALVFIAPLSHVELFAGYRWIDIDAKGETDGQRFTADLQITGFVVGGGLSF